MAVSRHLGFYRIGNSAIRSAFPENASLEPNMEWIGYTVCEIFAFKLYYDLETGVRGHTRSSKVTPFDSLHMVSRHSNFVCKMHRLRDITTYWSKIAKKPTPLSFGTFLWGDPLRVFRRLSHTCQKLDSWGYQMVYNSRSILLSLY